MTVGERIRKIRQKNAVSQTDLANACKISKQTLYKYENDIITNIPSDKIELIADYFSISPAYIMGWTDSEIPYTSKDENTNNNFSNHEKKVINAYRNKPEMQPAVDKLLGVEEEVLIPTVKAARSKDNRQRIEIVNLPDLSKFKPDDTDL